MTNIIKKYPFLRGFYQVSQKEFGRITFGYYKKKARRVFATNAGMQLTHLLIKDDDLYDYRSWVNDLKQSINEYIAEFIESLIEYDAVNSLEILVISQLRLAKLPDIFGQFKQLTHLDIVGNQLRTLPESLGQLSHLTDLRVTGNRLGDLPESIGNLQHLTYLNVEQNQLSTLPESLGQLSNLTDLNVANNLLNALPVSIGQMLYLTSLNVDCNQIKTLPESMIHLQQLKRFFIKDNPISQNIHQLANKLQPSDLITYLLEIQQPQTQTLNEAKVLVLGDERVGKTSLVRGILGDDLDENQETTLGIDIEEHKLKNGIKINIWDFAGQEITHQTHQFFLSHRSLYLLVLDAQKQDNHADISMWLNTIKSTAGADAPIIVVVNKCDLNPGQFDRYKYQQDFKIVDVIYTSTVNQSQLTTVAAQQVRHRICDLIDIIAQQVAEFDEVRLPFPRSWLAIKKSLEAKQEQEIDFIESAQYEEICESHGVYDVNWQDALLAILNQIGTIVTYKDDERLNSMQIINPIWVTNGVYKILRSPLIKPSEATLNQEQFREIFVNDDKYAKARHYTWLIDLLKQFRLAFSQGDQYVLLPARLSTNQPNFDLASFRQGLNFRFLYEGLLKASTISQFIVYLHEYISKEEVKYWKRGVFLTFVYASEQANAVVISDEQQKVINIAVQQANRAGRELLVIIRHALRKINGPEIEVEEQVPLIDNGVVIGFKSFDDVIEAEQAGENRIRARILPEFRKNNQSSRSFAIAELLDGYRIQDPTFNYAQLTEDLLIICCLLTESCQAIMDESEDATNDRFRDLLSAKNYLVADQSRGGESQAGKQAGERDLVIRNSQTHVAEAIIEAFVLNQHDSQRISEHLEKLIEKYDTTGNQYNYLLVYVKSPNFYKLWDKYKSTIGHFEDTSDRYKKNRVLTGYSSHGERHFKSTVNHFFIGFSTKLAE